MARNASMIWTLVGDLGRPVHGLARQPRGHHGDPRPAGRPRRVDRAARVDGQRVHPHLRGAAPHGRRARRPVRPAPHVRHRACDLHARLGVRRAGAVDRGAQPRPCDPGRRWRDRHAAHADAAERCGARAQATRARARDLGRRRRACDRVRAGGRRRRRRGHLLAVGLLAQRPDRAGADPARAAAARRVARAGRAGSTCPVSRSSARASSAIVWGLIRGNSGGLDEPEHPRLDGGRRSLLVGAFVAWELRTSAPMLRLNLFRSRTFTLANVASLFMFFGMFGSIFLLAQFFQTVQGYGPLGSGLRILPWTLAPIFIAPLAGAMSDRIDPKRIIGTGLTMQAVALAWIASVSSPDDPVLAAGDPVRHGRASAWRSSSRRSPTSSSAPCDPRKRGRRRVRTTRSASSAASSAWPCWRRCSRGSAATTAVRTFTDGTSARRVRRRRRGCARSDRSLCDSPEAACEPAAVERGVSATGGSRSHASRDGRRGIGPAGQARPTRGARRARRDRLEPESQRPPSLRETRALQAGSGVKAVQESAHQRSPRSSMAPMLAPSSGSARPAPG